MALVSEVDALAAHQAGLPIDFYQEMRSYEIALVCWAMGQARGSQKLAAELLNLNPTSLNSIIKKCGLRIPKRKPRKERDQRAQSTRKRNISSARKTFLRTMESQPSTEAG